MNVLIHGTPFFCDMGIVGRYEGSHVLRTFGPTDEYDYAYRPLEETASEAIRRFADDWQPDLLLCWQPEADPPPRGIEDVNVRTVALVSDWNVYYPVLEKNLARYDVVLTDKPGVEVFTRADISPYHIRPLYSQIVPIHYPHDAEKDIDVLFIGNLNHAAHRQRAGFLERLAKLSDRYRIVIATGIEGDAYGHLMSRARIVFNHSIRGEVNLRVFETMACGALAMLEDTNLEVRDWFTDGEDIVLFNESNFEEVLLRYLRNPVEAQQIAAAGHERIATMSGEHTLDDVIDKAAAIPTSGRGFRSFAEENRLFQTALMYGRLRDQQWRPYVAGLFGHLLEATPQNAEVHAAYVHFLMGDANQDRDRILEHARRAADLEPDSIPYAWNLLRVEEWSTNTKTDASRLLALLDKNGTQGAGLLLGTQADPFWTRCYWLLALTGDITPETFHAEILVRSVSNTDTYEEGLRRLDRAQELDSLSDAGSLMLAEIIWNHGKEAEAADYLQSLLLDQLPLNMEAREKLLEWLLKLGRTDEWQALTAETLRIIKAFPETV